MGLFLGPFAGHATGGGGHGVMDPPPPGTGDPGSGPRSEVDTVGRSPVRLLKTTMNKHKPKFMKIVPPGQQRGTLAPPYAWDALERDDWRYELPKRTPLKGIREGEFDHPTAPKPAPLPGAHQPQSAPGHPTQQHTGNTATASRPDPGRSARVNAIHAELKQLRLQMQGLTAKLHQATERGKQEIESGKKFNAPAVPDPYRGESLQRSGLRLVENDYTPLGIARREADPPRPGWGHNPHDTSVWMPNDQEHEQSWKADNLRQRGIPRGLKQSPKASAEIVQIHKELAQKRQQIQKLTDELKSLRQRVQESVGFSSNNLHRIALLLK